MTETEKPAPKPVKVSKSLCKKALQAMFGPTAYLQALHEDGNPGKRVIGMRAVAKQRGQITEIVAITAKPDQVLEAEHIEELPFHVVREAGRSFDFDVRRGKNKHGRPDISWKRFPPPIDIDLPEGGAEDRKTRLAEEPANALSGALERREMNLSEFCGDCQGCGPDDQPCVAWGHWAVKALGLKQVKSAPARLGSDVDLAIVPAPKDPEPN